jgi:alkylation response protein AidB-like acyl-CoA dehydrogenase
LISGEAIGAFLLTEPGAGSDATSIQTLATEKNDKFIPNGTKA